MGTTNVMLIDRDPVTNTALQTLLESDSDVYVQGNAHNLEEARRVIKARDVDVILMDINVNNKTSTRAIRTLKKEFPESRILALLYHEPPFIEKVLEEGASGYFIKTHDLSTLFTAINKIHKEGTFRPSNADYQQEKELLSRVFSDN